MSKLNSVFIATSIDGFIADKDGGIDWLNSVPNPDGIDLGYYAFMSRIDALVMGRTTFETVLGFDVDWPYQKPVFVLSNSLDQIPGGYEDKVALLRGPLKEVLRTIHSKGHHRLYIDGGKTIQGFLREDLIDEMIITTIPVVLGGGYPLFAEADQMLKFKCTKSTILLEAIVQNHYVRDRS